MSVLKYPTGYDLPKKNVLVLSCMDLRLTDNLVNFLHFDNLANRYDHFILAGTSLCTTLKSKKNAKYFKNDVLESYDNFELWSKSFNDHLNLAIALHHIKDVYVIEHQDCGAYKNFLKEKKLQQGEKQCHQHFAVDLAEEIHNVIRIEQSVDEESASIKRTRYQLGVYCFYIDLRGNVELLKSYQAK